MEKKLSEKYVITEGDESPCADEYIEDNESPSRKNMIQKYHSTLKVLSRKGKPFGDILEQARGISANVYDGHKKGIE